ncbi:hypothetical protein ACRAWF_21060, partial [Streptomyces sp. L7]
MTQICAGGHRPEQDPRRRRRPPAARFLATRGSTSAAGVGKWKGVPRPRHPTAVAASGGKPVRPLQPRRSRREQRSPACAPSRERPRHLGLDSNLA